MQIRQPRQTPPLQPRTALQPRLSTLLSPSPPIPPLRARKAPAPGSRSHLRLPPLTSEPPNRAHLPGPRLPPQKGVVYLNADANVYDLTGKKIARSHVGDRIGSYGRNGKSNWWLVNYRGTQARIDVKYISGKPVAKYRNHLVWITNNSYVYDRASMSSRKVASINRGKYVGTRGPAQGGWWPVNYRGRDA